MPSPPPPTSIELIAPYIQCDNPSAFAPAMWSGVEEGYNTSGAYAQVTIKVLWSQRWIVMGLIKGLPVTLADGGATITYWAPLQYPGQPNLYADDVKAIPQGRNTPQSTPDAPYKYALITIHFSTPTYSMTSTDQALLTINSSVSGNFVTIPDNVYSFVSDGTKTKQDLGVLVPEETITITRHLCSEINRAAYISVVGNVHNDVLFGYPAGCVLLNGIESTYETTQYGTQMYSVTYSLACKVTPWSQFLHPSGSFQLVQDSNGNPPYPSADITAAWNY